MGELSRPVDPRERVIEIVESFPDAEAVPVAGLHLSLEVKGKRFGWFMENHHCNERIEINCKALPGVGQAMVAANSVVYYIPAMIRRWGVGIWLDVDGIDWDEVRDLLFDAYLMAAPKPKQKKRVQA